MNTWLTEGRVFVEANEFAGQFHSWLLSFTRYHNVGRGKEEKLAMHDKKYIRRRTNIGQMSWQLGEEDCAVKNWEPPWKFRNTQMDRLTMMLIIPSVTTAPRINSLLNLKSVMTLAPWSGLSFVLWVPSYLVWDYESNWVSFMNVPLPSSHVPHEGGHCSSTQKWEMIGLDQQNGVV